MKSNEAEKNIQSLRQTERERIDFNQLEKVDREKNRLERFERKIYLRKMFLRSPVEVGEKVLILAGKIKKKDLPEKFYKSIIENQSHFYEKQTYLITNKRFIGNYFYWIKSTSSGEKINNRFPREEIYSLLDNFM